MSLLAIDNLSVTLAGSAGPLPVLRQIDLSMEAGATLGLVGESGSGKSMTALAIMGLLPPRARTEGSVRLDGRELTGLADADLCTLRGAAMSMIFQEPMSALNPLHRIGAQIAEPLRLHRGVSRAQALETANRLLQRVGMEDAAQRCRNYPFELSGGQRQRVMIAMALACGPRLLIADEPTTALDATTQATTLALLRDLVRQEALALLLISHDLGVIAGNASHLAVMYAGQIVETGPTLTVLAHPAHPYTRGLVAARPSFGRSGRLPTIAGTAPAANALPPGCSFAPRCPIVLPACAVAPVAMHVAGPGHLARCLRTGEAG